jgi:hypothetical protein
MNKWHMLCFCDAAGRREEEDPELAFSDLSRKRENYV